MKKPNNFQGAATLPNKEKRISEKSQRLLNELDVKVALNSYNIIANYVLSKNGEKDNLSGFVYQVSCADCNLIYIGHTKQSLKSR